MYCLLPPRRLRSAAGGGAAATYHRCCAVLLLTQLPSHGLGQPAIYLVAEPRGVSILCVYLTFIFQPLEKPWSQVRFLSPPGKCLRFYRAEGPAFPTLVGSIIYRLGTQQLKKNGPSHRAVVYPRRNEQNQNKTGTDSGVLVSVLSCCFQITTLETPVAQAGSGGDGGSGAARSTRQSNWRQCSAAGRGR